MKSYWTHAPSIVLHIILTYKAVFTIFVQVVQEGGYLGKIKQRNPWRPYERTDRSDGAI